MATFHLFPLLPTEIRLQIWESTVEPRVVEVRTGPHTNYVVSSTPVPAVLHACHEARSQQLYQQAFAFGKKPRYLWVNFEVDTVSLGETYFETIESDQPLIRSLMFEREDDESFFQFESWKLKHFLQVERILVICKDGLLAWSETVEQVYWPCGEKNVTFVDKETREEAKGWELEKMWADLLADEERAWEAAEET